MVRIDINLDNTITWDDPTIHIELNAKEGTITTTRLRDPEPHERQKEFGEDGEEVFHGDVYYHTRGGYGALHPKPEKPKKVVHRPVHVPGEMHPSEFKKSLLVNRNEGLAKIRDKHRRMK